MNQYEMWVEKICKKSGKPEKEIIKEIDEMKKKYKEFVQSIDIAALMLAKKYGISVEMASNKLTSIEEVFNGIGEHAKLKGMLVGLADRDSYYSAQLVYGGYHFPISLNKDIITFEPKDFMCLELSDVFISRKREIPYGFLDKTCIIKEIKDCNLDKIKDVCDKYTNTTKEGDMCYFRGVITNVDEMTYTGCPVCLRKVEDICEKHNVKGELLGWKHTNITNGKITLDISLSPLQDFPATAAKLLGSMAFAIGIYKEENLELSRGSFILVEEEINKPNIPAEVKVEESKSEKAVKNVSKEEAKKVLLNYVKLYNSLKAEASIKLLNTKLDVGEEFVIELIDELENDKKILIQDGIITIAVEEE